MTLFLIKVLVISPLEAANFITQPDRPDLFDTFTEIIPKSIRQPADEISNQKTPPLGGYGMTIYSQRRQSSLHHNTLALGKLFKVLCTLLARIGYEELLQAIIAP